MATENNRSDNIINENEIMEVEIDVESLDSELAAARDVEQSKNTLAGKIAMVFAFCMSFFHIWTGLFGLLDQIGQRGTHLAFAISILILTQPLSKKAFKGKFKDNKTFSMVGLVVDIAMIIGIWYAVYISRIEYLNKSATAGAVSEMAQVAGFLLLVIVLECTRRSLGYIMPVLATIFIIYALIGRSLPLAIAHRGYSWSRIFTFLSTNADGIFGTCLSVSATVIFMFVMFGAFLEVSGCSNWINDMAISLTGHIKSGPALSAVIASALMGTINGSAVANVVGTGTFTIPLMKSRGYKPSFAGGVEAVASTGGQILPPVMGSGAFLMVAFTNVSYVTIAASAAIPAVMYFLGCAFAVIAQAEIADIEPTPEDQIPNAKKTFFGGLSYLLIIAVLIWGLLVAQLSPLRAALWGCMAVPVVMTIDALLCYVTRKDKSLKLFNMNWKYKPTQIPETLVKAGFSSITVVMGCACAGIVVSMVALTGIGVVFGDMMIKASGGVLFLSLLFTAMACIVLGMGLPTTAAYVIAASILAPALVKLGLPLLNAHIFIFYYACLSAITPPVALAAYAGAGIAKCNPMACGIEACKIGFAGFIVPFVFAYNPALILQGSLIDIISVTFTCFIGVICMSMGFQGWYFIRLNPILRILLIFAGVVMVIPETITDVIGIVTAVLITVYTYTKSKKQKAIVA